MAKKPNTAGDAGATPEPQSYLIAAKAAAGFWRAGRHWPKEGAVADRAEFTDEQWAALEAEPALIVTQLPGAV